MSQQDPPSDTSERGPQGGDPWHAFGYVVAGVAFYGFLGWWADRWLGTTFLVAVGILFGATLGIYLTISRFDALPRFKPDPPPPDPQLPDPESPDPQSDTK